MAQLGPQVVLVLPALPDQPEPLALLDPRGLLVLRELPALPDRRVLLARQDPREPTVQQVRQDPPGLLEPQDRQVPQGPREILDPQDLLDLPDLLGLREQAVPQDRRAVRQR